MGGSSLATPPLEQAPVGTEPPRRANARITDRSAMTQLGLGTGTDRAVVEKASNTARHLKRGNALRSAPTNTKRIADRPGRRKGLLHGRGTTYGMGRSVLDVPAPDCELVTSGQPPRAPGRTSSGGRRPCLPRFPST